MAHIFLLPMIRVFENEIKAPLPQNGFLNSFYVLYGLTSLALEPPLPLPQPLSAKGLPLGLTPFTPLA